MGDDLKVVWAEPSNKIWAIWATKHTTWMPHVALKIWPRFCPIN